MATPTLPNDYSSYPVFAADQVLTSDDLNEMFNFLDEQERLSRIYLVGMGIVCGFEISVDLSKFVISVSAGNGITSFGYLLFQDAIDLSFYQSYTIPTTVLVDDQYAPFTTGSTSTFYQLQSSAYVNNLSTSEQAKWTALSAGGTSLLSGMLVVLYLEMSEDKLKTCLTGNCDGPGADMDLTIRYLLVNQSDLYPGMAIVKLGAILSSNELPDLYLPKFNVPSGSLPDFTSIYTSYSSLFDTSVPGNVVTQLSGALQNLYTFLQPILEAYPTSPFLQVQTTLTSILTGIQKNKPFAIQYYYDLISDLILAYSEAQEVCEDWIGSCSPNVGAFPLHLSLGWANQDTAGQQDDYRNYFQPSMLIAREPNTVEQLRSLFDRIYQMINTFVIPAYTVVNAGVGTLVPTKQTSVAIRVTPSFAGRTPLSQRAIPYYYPIKNNSPIQNDWNYELTLAGKENENLSYNAGLYNVLPGGNPYVNPLMYDIMPYDFFRIEGHIGQSYSFVLSAITALINTYRLPFNVVALKLGTDSGDLSPNAASFADLTSQYDVLKSSLLCTLGTQVCFYGSQTYTAPGQFTFLQNTGVLLGTVKLGDLNPVFKIPLQEVIANPVAGTGPVMGTTPVAGGVTTPVAGAGTGIIGTDPVFKEPTNPVFEQPVGGIAAGGIATEGMAAAGRAAAPGAAAPHATLTTASPVMAAGTVSFLNLAQTGLQNTDVIKFTTLLPVSLRNIFQANIYTRGQFLSSQPCFASMSQTNQQTATVGLTYMAKVNQGSAVPANAATEISSLSDYLLALLDLIDAVVADVYYVQLGYLNLTDFTTKYNTMTSYAASIVTLLNQNPTAAPAGMIDQLNRLQASCNLGQLTALSTDYQTRYTALQQAMLFGNFVTANPAIDHRGGVPKGGTFLLAYYEKPPVTAPTGTTVAGQLATNITDTNALKNIISTAAASPNVASARFASARAASPRATTPGNVSAKVAVPTAGGGVATPRTAAAAATSNTLTQLVGLIQDKQFGFTPAQQAQILGVLNQKVSPAVALTDASFSLTNLSVVADFFLPYTYNPQGGAITYVFPAATGASPNPAPSSEFVVSPDEFLSNDPNTYHFTVVPAITQADILAQTSDPTKLSNPDNLVLTATATDVTMVPSATTLTQTLTTTLQYESMTQTLTIIVPLATFTISLTKPIVGDITPIQVTTATGVATDSGTPNAGGTTGTDAGGTTPTDGGTTPDAGDTTPTDPNAPTPNVAGPAGSSKQGGKGSSSSGGKSKVSKMATPRMRLAPDQPNGGGGTPAEETAPNAGATAGSETPPGTEPDATIGGTVLNPIRPVIPVTPIRPIAGPTEPVIPVATNPVTTNPVTPVAPTPVTPIAGPTQPVTPVTPTPITPIAGPTQPVIPINPTPVTPVAGPTRPGTDPNQPTPVTPVAPVTDPTQPVIPIPPVTAPVVPVNPLPIGLPRMLHLSATDPGATGYAWSINQNTTVVQAISNPSLNFDQLLNTLNNPTSLTISLTLTYTLNGVTASDTKSTTMDMATLANTVNTGPFQPTFSS